MTVAELIDQLENYGGHLPVKVRIVSPDGLDENVQPVEQVDDATYDGVVTVFIDVIDR